MLSRCLLRTKLRAKDYDMSQSGGNGNREWVWREGRWACQGRNVERRWVP